MKQLFVLRHLKSDWDDPTLEDHDRALSRRGLRDGTVLGPWLRQKGIAAPDLILCSTALRTRETLAFVMPYLDPLPQVQLLGKLYLASADDILAQVRQYGGGASRIMVIGHNDGLHNFAGRLIGSGDPELVERAGARFPTGTMARFDLTIGRWQDLGWRAGCLTGYETPKERQIRSEAAA